MRIRFFLILVFLLLVPVLASAADGPGAGSFSQLKARYLSLRNTDPGGQQSADWEALADELQAAAAAHPAHPDAASALFNAAVLHEQLYRKLRRAQDGPRAVEIFERLAEKYPQHEFADDALIRSGDLLFQLHDTGRARENYAAVFERYHEADMHPVAAARLKAIAGKSLAVRAEPSPTAVPQGEGARRKKLVVVIDPGHGGEDFGARGQGQLLEKDVVLDVALRLEQLLARELQAVVRLTRRGDAFMPLLERTNLANDFEADLFISLHTNASPNHRIRGLETYYLDNTGDKASRKLAERENRAGGGQVSDLQFMLSDLVQNAKLGESIALANRIDKALGHYLSAKWKNIRRLGVKKAPFYVLVGAHMPCVLVELFFIDDDLDGQRLSTKEFRQDLAQGLLEGIRAYIGHLD